MKNSLLRSLAPSCRTVAFFFAAVLLTTISCEQDDAIEKDADGRIEFSISIPDAIAGGRAKALQSVIITVKNTSGQIIHEKKKLSLIQFGDSYLSEPLAMKTGNFKLTEFVILDENNAASLATPVEGSALAYLASDPLPIDFTVAKDKTKKVSPQVIKVEGQTAANFGYVNFGFEIVNTIRFLAGVFAYNTVSGSFELTTSELNITAGTKVVFNQSLTATTREIVIEDGHATYAIKVTKSGYLPYEKTFTAAELKAHATTPLILNLLQRSIANGLVAHYPFTGNANDATANNFDGIVHGATLTTDRKGQANTSYSFDGVDDYIRVPHNDALNFPNNFSVSLWVVPSSTQADPAGINDILRKFDNNGTYGYPFAICYLSTDNALVENRKKILFARFGDNDCNNGNYPYATSPATSFGANVHVVFIKEGGVLRHYLNNVLIGEFEDTTSKSGCSVINTADMTIGARGNLIRHFKGKIDDIRIYNRALTSSEVTNLYAE